MSIRNASYIEISAINLDDKSKSIYAFSELNMLGSKIELYIINDRTIFAGGLEKLRED